MIRPVRYTSPLKAVSDYVVLDTETTGVDPEKDKIIEVGLIEVRNNVIVDRFSSFVNPGRHIPAAASRVNHIYDVDVADAPTYKQIAPTLARWLIGKVVVAHNAKFDLTLVKNLLEKFGYSGNIRYIDTLFYSRRAVEGVENYKLQTLAAHFGIDPGSAHRAVDDAVTCHYIFQECKRLTWDDTFSQKPVRSAFSDVIPAKDIMPSRPVSPGSPLYDKVVVFTGDFTISNNSIMQKAVDAGAIVKDDLTMDTDFLVEGKQDPAYVGKGGKSQKQLRAAEINRSGKGNIRIIGEKEFTRLCSRSSPEKARTVSRQRKTVRKQSTGAMIAKIAFGILFVIVSFSSPEDGWSWGYFFTSLVIGGALIAWGLLPYLKAKKQESAAKAEEEVLKRELLNEPRVCKACGATSKGKVCEYCGTKLE